MAYLDDAVKQCPALRIQFFDVKLRQTLSLFLLRCSGMLNVLQKNYAFLYCVDGNLEILDALKQCPTLRIEQP